MAMSNEKAKSRYIEKVINSWTKTLLITHNDLDGLGCAILFKKFCPNTQVIFASNTEVNDIVGETVKMISPIKDREYSIIISDLSVNKRVAAMLNDMYMNTDHLPLILDHHSTAKPLHDMFIWANVDTTKCGTRLCYDALKKRFPQIAQYSKFVDIVS